MFFIVDRKKNNNQLSVGCCAKRKIKRKMRSNCILRLTFSVLGWPSSQPCASRWMDEWIDRSLGSSRDSQEFGCLFFRLVRTFLFVPRSFQFLLGFMALTIPNATKMRSEHRCAAHSFCYPLPLDEPFQVQ